MMNEYIKNITNFAKKYDLQFVLNGTVGFGRECIGLLYGYNYVSYNPTMDCYDKDGNWYYKNDPEFYDERLYKIRPENAYHKSPCLAVLGCDEDKIRQLSDWVTALEELGIEMVTITETRESALSHGEEIKTIKVKK